jgi:hypothetical protein
MIELMVKLKMDAEDRVLATPTELGEAVVAHIIGESIDVVRPDRGKSRDKVRRYFAVIDDVEVVAGGEKVLAVETTDLKTVIQAAKDRAGNLIRSSQSGRGRASERAMSASEGYRILTAIEKMEGES